MRTALGIEYDGTAYNGWQRQKIGIGVQELVEKAIASVANEAIKVTCAGRTDTGVHASGQVIHFNSTAERSERGWLRGINTHLPADINVHWARPVSAEFHARYSALSRSYRYLILNRVARSALYRHRAWWVYQPLDADLMHRALRLLIGRHDFSAFRAAGCQASTPVREVLSADVKQQGDWITITITANAFLQHMVRNITGLLMAVGAGQQVPEWAGEVLECRDRTKGGIAAPAQGLTLIGVEYPEEFSIPSQFVYDAIL